MNSCISKILYFYEVKLFLITSIYFPVVASKNVYTFLLFCQIKSCSNGKFSHVKRKLRNRKCQSGNRILNRKHGDMTEQCRLYYHFGYIAFLISTVLLYCFQTVKAEKSELKGSHMNCFLFHKKQTSSIIIQNPALMY